MKNKISGVLTLPVLFGFFVMGFADVVGISSNYIKMDFGLSDSLANLLPMMVFLWFAVFSVPTGVMMNKAGRKNTVLVSMVISFAGLMLPLAAYRFETVLVAFALLGIGNTILQVSLNPLLTNVVSNEKLTSSLTLGQFIKAIASFLGPVIAGFASSTLGDWKIIFPIFASITILSGLLIYLTPIPREKSTVVQTSMRNSFRLLSDPVIRMLFVGIILVVGIDVGLNTTLPKFMMERFSIPLEKAGLAISLYFAARTVGTFAGAIILMKIPGRKVYVTSAILGIISMGVLLIASNLWVVYAMILGSGLAVANIFPVIFSAALKKVPDRSNEVSGLLIMGVAGGAIVPPVMGIVSDNTGQTGAMLILLLCFIYLLYNALKTRQ